ncbi:hypothetical protein T190130A13A_30091 [Tenacibaculum sp. 190130A14a]
MLLGKSNHRGIKGNILGVKCYPGNSVLYYLRGRNTQEKSKL